MTLADRSLADILRARLDTLDYVDATEHEPSLQLAAVLVLLYPRHGRVYFPLTVRLDTLAHHAGQISLPGGRLETTDLSGWQGALREAREEVGLRTGRVRPLGRLEVVPTVVSGHLIVPYVGWSPVAPRLRPSPGEVTEVLEIPLDAILDPTSVREQSWELRDRPLIVTSFDLAGHTVWGATARILSDLAIRINPSLDFGPHPPGSVRPR